ncbi:hypothetical protein QBC37DRAFT_457032 [Rhypophila decipiens]|uniref:Uncharacterized protein n=1 Tax=Rhypophila decipiens TaxID=261697 RepID=A0AAN6YI45_9PEZI|nr:hypothetical protein QBC37DRAFT_457032 [Rhypophila decipiens]
MATAKELALKRAMMEADLGIHRVEELPLEDGNYGPVSRHHNALQAQVGSRAGETPISHRPRKIADRPARGVSNRWKAAIEGGEFDDEDSEAVEKLDDLGDETGRLYASRRGNGGMPTHPELHGRLAQSYHQSGRELPPSALLRSEKRFGVSKLGIVQLDGDAPILSLNRHRGAVPAQPLQPRLVQAANVALQEAALRPAQPLQPKLVLRVGARPGAIKAQNPRPQQVASGPSPAQLQGPPQLENLDHSQRMGTVMEQNADNRVFEALVSYIAQRRGKKESPGQVTLHQSRPPAAEKGSFRLFVVDKLFAEHRISDWHNYSILDVEQALLTVRFRNRGKENTKPKDNSNGEDHEYSLKFNTMDGANGANHFLETVNSVLADLEVPYLPRKPIKPKNVKVTTAATKGNLQPTTAGPNPIRNAPTPPATQWQTRLASPADFDPFSVTIGPPRPTTSSSRDATTTPRAVSAKPSSFKKPSSVPPAGQKRPLAPSTAPQPAPGQQSSVGLRPPPGFAASPSLVKQPELEPSPGPELRPFFGLKPPPGLNPPPGFGPSPSSTERPELIPPPGLDHTPLISRPPGLNQPSIDPQSNQQAVLERVPSFDLPKPLFEPPNGAETSPNTSRETARDDSVTQTTEDVVNLLRQIVAVRDEVSSSGSATDMTAMDAAQKLLESFISAKPKSSDAKHGAGSIRARRVQYSADQLMACRSNAARPPHWLSELRFLPARSGLDKRVARRPTSPMGWESPTQPAPGIQEQIAKIVASAHEIELRKEGSFAERVTGQEDIHGEVDAQQPQMGVQMSFSAQTIQAPPSEASNTGLSASTWAYQDDRIEHPNSFTGAPGAWPESSYMSDLMQLVLDPPADGISSSNEVVGMQESLAQSASDGVLDAIASFKFPASPSPKVQKPVPTPPVWGLRASRWA